MEPRVSVVVPTIRDGRFLGEALASVSRQTYSSWEVIVVDDGADDAAGVEEAVATVPGATLLRQARSGVSIARNAGALHARGEFVAFLDDDDVWEPGRLEAQVSALDASPAAVACYSSGYTIESDGRKVSDDWTIPGGSRQDMLSGAVDIPRIVTLLVRRDEFFRLGGFNPAFRYGEDNELILRLLQYGEMTFVQEALVGYRRHDSNVTSAPGVEVERAADRLITLQIWGAQAAGDSERERLLRENLAAFRRRVARGLAHEGLHRARRLKLGQSVEYLGAALKRSPGATLGALRDATRRRSAGH
jgi:glycosyltransferase involved in cell wall biosynthesis